MTATRGRKGRRPRVGETLNPRFRIVDRELVRAIRETCTVDHQAETLPDDRMKGQHVERVILEALLQADRPQAGGDDKKH